MPPRKTRRSATAEASAKEAEDAAAAEASQTRGKRDTSQATTADQSANSPDDHDRSTNPNDSPDQPMQEPQTTTSEVRASLAPSMQQHTDEAFVPRDPASHIKILLATDNHVGFMERDSVRGQDSINTFREILQLAVARDVDMILLGGDLFHENHPSRGTLRQVMACIREYCMGDKPVSLELLSDPNDGQAEGFTFPAVNYEDFNLNVSIPIFSIHGNHDEPQGVGVDGALSALDLLSVSGLLNYFGKLELPESNDMTATSTKKGPDASGDAGIRIRPVLLQKGNTKLALYGMGNIRDERMHFELRANRVRMYRPREDPDTWFNILCLHQNRAAPDPKAAVPETMFDDSLHLVVWGHEHEQKINPEPVGGKRYHITQPGSSIATSMGPGEAAEKCVAVIHIEGQDFSLEPIPLQTVRPFISDDMQLMEEAEDAGVPLDDKNALQKLLKRRVNELIEKAEKEYDEQYANIRPSDRPERMLPLIRLRVEYSATLDLGNPIRFGQEFVGKVANPREVLHFNKKAVRTKKRAPGGGDSRYAYVDVEPEDVLKPEQFEKIKIGGLVNEYLTKQNLELLNAEGLERAISNYVDKDDREAIGHFVGAMMKTMQGSLNSLAPDEGQLDAELLKIRDDYAKRARRRAEGEGGGDDDDMDEDAPEPGPSSRKKATAAGKKAAASKQAAQADSDDSMLDDMPEGDDPFDGAGSSRSVSPVARRGAASTSKKPASSSRSKAPAKSSTSRGGGRSNGMFRGQDDDDEDEDMDDFVVDDSDEDRASMPPPSSKPAGKSRAAVLEGSKTPARKKAPAASSSRKTAAKSPTARKPSGRAAASKATKTMSKATEAGSDDDDGSESPGFEVDEEASQPAVKGGRRR